MDESDQFLSSLEKLESADPHSITSGKVDTQLHENICSHLPKNIHIGKTELPEVDLTSPANHYGTYSHSYETDFSSLNETLTPDSTQHPPPHRKHKLSHNELSDNDCTSVPYVKHRLISNGSFKSDMLIPSVSDQSSDSDCSLSHLSHGNDELRHNIALKSASDCEKTLRQIIRTAYQFTRHSHREKLSLQDLEKAFKIHNVDMGLYDSDWLVAKVDRDSADDEDELKPFTCTGKWLSQLEDLNLDE